MKRRYRESDDKSSQAVDESPEGLEIPLDRDEVLGLLRAGLHNFATEIGRIVAMGLLNDEVTQLCGKSHQRLADRDLTRHGSQPGWVTIAGQKLPVKRPRVRRADDRGEVRLPVYALLQEKQQMNQAVLRRMVRGVSCRNYEAVVDCARTGFGVKRSSVSRAFRSAMAGRIRRLSNRRWDGVRFAAIFIDGKVYAGETMIAALGVKADGTKVLLGLRQGATENTEVCKDLLEDLQRRGVATDRMTLFVLDGSQALRAAVKRVWGRYALIQRCREHKRRNVRAYLDEKYWPELDRRLYEAYASSDYDQALKVMQQTASWLKGINPDAAKSLREGMEETLTVIRLGVGSELLKTLGSTNVIESSFSSAGAVSGRVKRWRRGVMRWRWCAAGLLFAEEHFHRVPGYRHIPKLIATLDTLGQQEGLDNQPQVA